ncbi:6098_t:CDS:2, partial [Cetraspora pellucida]
DTETGASVIFQPEKRRRMLEWYLLGKLSFNHLEKLQQLKDKKDKPRLDPAKKYLLSDLLLLIPKRKKPKPKPQNAPLKDQIERFDKEFTERTVKYIELIEKKNKHELEGFITNYDQEPEKNIYEQEKYKDKIKDILEDNANHFEPDDLYAKPKYYDELFFARERQGEELLFSSLTAHQWNNLDEESELRQGIFELRKFPNLKKLKIKVERPYIGAPVIKKIDLSATADNLEELDLSQSEHLQEIII